MTIEDHITAIHSAIAHPRSLARNTGEWRPPTIKIPTGSVSIMRHRIGPRVKARVRGFGETHTPAYVVTARFTSTERNLSATDCLPILRALYPEWPESAAHELSYESAPTFCWLVDGHFSPVSSPASLFEGLRAA